MPDDQNTSQNPTPEENSIPVSPQEPTADAPILPIDSEPAEALLEVPEDPGDGFSAKSDNIPPSNSTLTEPSNEPKPEEKSAQNEPSIELQPEAGQSTAEVSNPVKVIEPSATTPADEVKADKPTAQISTNEPLKSKPEENLPPLLLLWRTSRLHPNQNHEIQHQRRQRLRLHLLLITCENFK